ncbi:hypothetical protein BCR32DRAFT_280770 [Anaeromyces robustus]|uniref:Uncharacterized protein n=1 Tax=Anaeromyces robustus TaxID=1754192 RepID=A0A1Y1X2X7_9FUNG|nr:hypothetical protein BCR32DRAFT_280770 [Anaeromyces robustus]|eukprot:ORX80169.1 hypothetical protein BCR32DRAFT_280770 [Anaeromyces robustus]
MFKGSVKIITSKTYEIPRKFFLIALGDNWIEIINLESYYKNVVYNKELSIKEALKATIFECDFEITSKGRIALNGKDITKKVIDENDEAIDNSNLLIIVHIVILTHIGILS